MASFRTKRGRCHLDGDRLRLESSLWGQLRRYWEGNRLLFGAYLVALGAVAGFVVTQALAGEYRRVLLWGGGVVAALGVGLAVNRLRGFTREEEIELDRILRVRAVEGRKGLTRPRFVVAYERDGQVRKRYVMMPSKWLSYGPGEFHRARETFEDAGIPVEEG